MNLPVFVFSEGNCIADGAAQVLDGNCKSIGYLGGLAGNTKIWGKPFEEAVYVRTLWSN